MRYLQLDFWLNLLDAFRDAWDDVQNFHDCDCAEREVCNECGHELWDPAPEPADEELGVPLTVHKSCDAPGLKSEIVYATEPEATRPCTRAVIIPKRDPDGPTNHITIRTVEEFERAMGYPPPPCWGLPREEDLN